MSSPVEYSPHFHLPFTDKTQDITMYLDYLATELLLHIFRSCDSVSDILNLASTCKRLRHVFHKLPNKMQILANAAEIEFGPVEDIVQLVTYNTSQPAHILRNAPMTDALLRQIIQIGRVAQRWESIYPVKKWKADYECRRSLTGEGRYRLRRAVYRLWLYHRAFHVGYHDRFTRHLLHVIAQRAQLLHNWTTAELAEIEDLRLIMSDIVQNHICPSNGAVQRKFRKRYPESNHQLTFDVHLNHPANSNSHYTSLSHSYPPFLKDSFHDASPTDSSIEYYFHTARPTMHNDLAKYQSRFRNDFFHDPSYEGWGDEIPHYYVVQDMMKLDPSQILWLHDHAPLKKQVEKFVGSLGDWFRDNGETFGDTLEWVMKERGGDVGELRVAIDEREMGIVLDS